ncbi:MAG: hypothetical protein NXI31_00645 [bacterium]|nr:hypothetical protein [bacterium]
MSKWVLMAVFLAGCCTSIPVTDTQYRHGVAIQWDGEPYCGLEPAPNAKVATAELQDLDRQLDAMIAAVPEQARVVVFIHGGLNTLSGALKRTEKGAAACEKWNAGRPAKKRVFPIFINWHSSLVTWYDRLFRVREGLGKAFWSWLTSPIVLVADFGRALTRLPVTTFLETRCSVSNLFGLRAVTPPPAGWQSPRVAIDEDYDVSLGDRAVSGVTQLVPGLVRPLTMFVTDAALYDSYRMMLRRMEMLFHTEKDFQRARGGTRVPEPNGVLSKLCRRLRDVRAQGHEIVLVGHSLGCVAVNEIVRRNPDLEFAAIVYMAAGCTGKDFEETVPPYLARHCDTNFYSLCLHPFADADEDNTYSFLPRGSLLEWLDTYALNVQTPLDLTFGKWNNAMRVLPLFDGLPVCVRRRIHIKGFPRRAGHPSKHGDFNDHHFWDPRFWNPECRAVIPRFDG